jgi:leucyl-tRNA synthetase
MPLIVGSPCAAYFFYHLLFKWQKIWDEKECFKAVIDQTKPKKYILEMLPYPSGQIHMGHIHNYTIRDVIARTEKAKAKAKAKGFNVLHLISWYAFGLTADNAAIQNKIEPSIWTMSNINYMKQQLKAIGVAYDWSREIATCTHDYYKHEQKMFADFLEHGLVYQENRLLTGSL